MKFRVLALDSNLKAANLKEGLTVYIQDSQTNRIKQWKNVQPTKGVYSGEIELSSDPVLGQWLINVESAGQTLDKNFDVEEYVLPKFEVIVDAQKHATFKEGKVTAIIRSKYTYGKLVKGEVTVSAYPTLYVGSLQPFSQNIIQRKVLPIDGKASVEFDIKKELDLQDEYERDIIIEAVVEETLTGRKQNSTSTVTLHKSKYVVDFVTEYSYYKPGLPYNGFVKVSTHGGVPIQDKVNKVVLKYKYTYDDQTENEEKISLDDNGMAKFSINIEPNATYFSLTAVYLDVTGNHYVSKKEAHNNLYLQAKLKTEK